MGFLTFAVLGRLFASRVGFVVLAVLAVGVAPGRWPGAAVRLFLMEGLQVGFLAIALWAEYWLKLRLHLESAQACFRYHRSAHKCAREKGSNIIEI